MPSLRARTASHVFLILDNLSCHTTINHPQLKIIELHPNTAAVYQPLDKGLIAMVKRRHTIRGYWDRSLQTSTSYWPLVILFLACPEGVGWTRGRRRTF